MIRFLSRRVQRSARRITPLLQCLMLISLGVLIALDGSGGNPWWLAIGTLFFVAGLAFGVLEVSRNRRDLVARRSIGQAEHHDLVVRYQRGTNRVRISVDGIEVYARSGRRPLTWELNWSQTMTVGERERHQVRIEKVRSPWTAIPYEPRVQIWVDGQLAEDHETTEGAAPR